MIILSRTLLLETAAGIDLHAPVLLWRSVLTRETIIVSSAQDDFPASNLATDSTIEVWKSVDNGAQTIELVTGGSAVDAIGLARHNFGSAQRSVSVQAQTGEAGGSAWVEIVAPQMLADDSPVLLRFPATVVERLRLVIGAGTAPASLAVIYAGKLLVMPHGISIGHVPLDQARDTQVANGRSEAGHYLGRIITGQSAQTTAAFDLLPIDWYYAEMQAFVQRGTSGPFFFAWLPYDRPADVGFAWLNTDPRPSMGSLFFDVSLDYGGIAW